MLKLVCNKKQWVGENYSFFLDKDSFSIKNGFIKGWFVNTSDIAVKLNITSASYKELCATVTYNHIRPKLAEMYPEIENVQFSGFEVNGINPSEGISFSIEGELGSLIELASIKSNRPLLYVHIAKTAGTTVNQTLVDWFGRDNSFIHVESKIKWNQQHDLTKVEYISGHVPYESFMRVNWLKHYRKAITFREPYSHVVSHLAWIKALSLEENYNRYIKHPPYIQRLADKMKLFDFSELDQLSTFVFSLTQEELNLLDNTQTRYIRKAIAKSRVDQADVHDALLNLDSFDFVGLDSDICGFLKKVATHYGFEMVNKSRRENVLGNKFGLSTENKEQMKVLSSLVRYDVELYKSVKERVGPKT